MSLLSRRLTEDIMDDRQIDRITGLLESLIQSVGGGDTQVVHEIFGTLFEAWVTHHQQQESLMRQREYPRLPGHHLAHMVIRYQLSVCAFKLAEAPLGAAPDAALCQRVRHLHQLQATHRRDFDDPLSAFLKGNAASNRDP